MFQMQIHWTPTNLVTIGSKKGVLISEVAKFQGENLCGKTYFKWPEYRGGRILGVIMRQSSL